jgi:hypothetical protein
VAPLELPLVLPVAFGEGRGGDLRLKKLDMDCLSSVTAETYASLCAGFGLDWRHRLQCIAMLLVDMYGRQSGGEGVY